MDRADDMLAAGQGLHILLVERDDADALAIQQALTDAGIAYTIERARSDRMRASELMRERDMDVLLVFMSDHPGGKANLLKRAVADTGPDGHRRTKGGRAKQRLSEARLAGARRVQQVLLERYRAFGYETREERLLEEISRMLVHTYVVPHPSVPCTIVPAVFSA